jgi:PAS domain S-box-containing protein
MPNSAARLLDAIASPVALLDRSGLFISSNSAWASLGVGVVGDDSSAIWPSAAEGIRQVLDGRAREFRFDDARLRLTFRPLAEPDSGAVVTAEHLDVETQHALARKLETEHDWLIRAQAVAKIGSWVLDVGHSTLDWSDETYRICGVPRDSDDLLAAFYERVHPDDRAALDAAFSEAVAHRKPHKFDHRLLMPDGTERWVQERCEITADEVAGSLRAIGTIQDITERKVAEAALQQSQQLLRIASEVGQIGGWNLHLDSMTVAWSDAVCAIHGVPPGYQPGIEEAINFYAPEYRSTIQDAVGACIRDSKPFDLELQILNIQGERVWVRAIGEASVDGAGNVIGVHGAFQNISQLKRVLDEWMASDERFRLVAQATSDVVWDYDIEKDLLWWSEGLLTQFGHEAPTPTAIQFWSDRVHPDDRERVTEGFHAAVTSGRRWRAEYRFQKGDGSYAQVIDQALIARDQDGRPYRAVGALVDVTQQRILEARLDQIQRVSSLGQLAANMAHEFNNVLMGIQPFAEVIRHVTQSVPKAQYAIEHIMQSVRRGKKVTDEILRFTRGVDPTLRPLDVRKWLLDFQPEAVALAGETIVVEVNVPDQSLEMQGDMAQLNQVLANLVINARDASPNGGRIIIAAARVDGEDQTFVDVSIQDFGTGMDATTLEHIFEPLFTTKKNGTGLGLAISQQVVTKHGGSMSAESRPGVGTTFHLCLPLNRRAAEPSKPSQPEPNALPKKVLIVEDDGAVADGISILLAAERVRTTIVREGAAAVPAIEVEAPEVVLLDIGLPDISGVEVFQQIHARWPQLPVVLMTGHYSPAELQSVLTLPHVAFLQKPFGADEIVRVLKTTCAAR